MNSIKNIPLAVRTMRSLNIRSKYKNSVPIIVLPGIGCEDLKLPKSKFLLQKDQEIKYLFVTIRTTLQLDKSKALFFFAGNSLIKPNELADTLDKKYADEDGFLYITYNCENTFG
jgi:hypothetical protein